MAHSNGKHADFESLRDQAVALRRSGHSLRQIRDELKVYNNDLLNQLVKGEPPPEWTKRPRAKDGLRAKARELRLQGWTYDQIEMELGCSKGSISLWVRDLPKPERRDPSEQAKLAARKRWEHELAMRDMERQKTKLTAAGEIGTLTDRELFLLGVGLYWAEGSKDKPYARREKVQFVNSDPDMIQVFIAWLDQLGVHRDLLRFRLMIHETGDIEAAEQYWADTVGVDITELQKTTVKKHNPRTVRKNVGEDYRGCLVVNVLQGAELYRRIEGAWYGIVGAVRPDDLPNRT
ncbi:hypothetical protein [Streptomyces sp. NPDC005017]|uniref:hypothetical protein n=1 Tax=Streptomyces sp. NPDC005017 TaxID=3364706 RepID=UPI0036C78B34